MEECYQCMKDLADKLPKTNVLYNSMHGGCYSTQFKAFSKQNYTVQDSNDDYQYIRTVYIAKVTKFGAVCKQQYPFIVKLISLYNQYNFCDISRSVQCIKKKQGYLPKLQSALEIVQSTDATLFGTDVDIKYIEFHNFKIEDVLEYHKEYVVSWLKNEQDRYRKFIEKHTKDISDLLGSDKCEWVLKNFNVTFDEEQHHDVLPWSTKKDWTERLVAGIGLKRLSFLDAISHYGENHFAIWMCQTHYSEHAMRFLLKHHDALDCYVDNGDNGDDKCSDLEIGLLCASGPYCELSVANAPQLLSWKLFV